MVLPRLERDQGWTVTIHVAFRIKVTVYAATAPENRVVWIISWHLIESFQKSCLFICPDLQPSSCFFVAHQSFSSLKQDVGVGMVIFSPHTAKSLHLKGFSNVIGICCQKYWPPENHEIRGHAINPCSGRSLMNSQCWCYVCSRGGLLTTGSGFQNAESLIFGAWHYILILHTRQQLSSLTSQSMTQTSYEHVLNWQIE